MQNDYTFIWRIFARQSTQPFSSGGRVCRRKPSGSRARGPRDHGGVGSQVGTLLWCHLPGILPIPPSWIAEDMSDKMIFVRPCVRRCCSSTDKMNHRDPSKPASLLGLVLNRRYSWATGPFSAQKAKKQLPELD